MQHTISPALRSVYQVFARNYSAKGTLQAVTGDLPRIAAMGFGWVYLTPVHCTGIRGRKGTLGSPYAVRDYRSVDPSLGTMDDFLALSEEAHRLGMYTGVFDVLQHEETIAVPIADGAYEDCITGNKISVREGRVSASLCPLLLKEKKARK